MSATALELRLCRCTSFCIGWRISSHLTCLQHDFCTAVTAYSLSSPRVFFPDRSSTWRMIRSSAVSAPAVRRRRNCRRRQALLSQPSCSLEKGCQDSPGQHQQPSRRRRRWSLRLPRLKRRGACGRCKLRWLRWRQPLQLRVPCSGLQRRSRRKYRKRSSRLFTWEGTI